MSDLKIKHNYEEDLDYGLPIEDESRSDDYAYLYDFFDEEDEMSEKETNAISCLLLSVLFFGVRLMLPDDVSKLLLNGFVVCSVLCLACGIIAYIRIREEEKTLEEIDEY